MSPVDDFVESVEEDTEEAQNKNVEGADSAGDGHVSDEHGQCADDGVGHSIFGVIGAVESPVVGGESDDVVGSIGEGVVVVVVAQSDADPEASNDEVELHGEDDNEEGQ